MKTCEQPVGSMKNATLSDDRGPACPNGWPMVDVTRVNSDPWVMDDCWHRGEFTRYSVRGTDIVVDEQVGDGIGAAYDRLMNAVVAAGYVGPLWFLHADYKILQNNETYTAEWRAKRRAEMAAWEAANPAPEYAVNDD